MGKDIIIMGAGGLAQEVYFYLLSTKNRVVAFADRDAPTLTARSLFGVPVIDETRIPDGATLIHAIGSGLIREKLQSRALTGAVWGSFVHPFAVVGMAFRAKVGCVICPGAIVTVDIELGLGAFININATIGHGTRAGDWLTVHPGANIAGNVTLGDRVTVGSNAAILPGLMVCSDVTIGAGAVVTKNIDEAGCYAGVPARRLS